MVSFKVHRAQYENAIKCNEAAKRGLEANYLKSVDLLEKEVAEIERRMDITKSEIKKDILRKQRDHLEEMSVRLDKEFENGIKEYDKSIADIKNKIGELDEKINMERSSLDFNIDRLKRYKDNPGTYNMTQVLENVINALEIIKNEKKNKKSTSSSS